MRFMYVTIYLVRAAALSLHNNSAHSHAPLVSYTLIYTAASSSPYANKVIDFIDPKRVIKHRLFRESCVFTSGLFVKDLDRLGRDMTKSIIIDNSIEAFSYHLDYGIPILSWYDQPNDRCLLDLLPCLRKLADADDITDVTKPTFRLSEFLASM
jgi:CTD small phosphatase-like protein 2